MSIYTGSLVYRKMDYESYRAYRIYHGMRFRSRKFGHQLPSFSSREFVGWWIEELKTFKGKTPSIGRIDHSMGYAWDNMFMQDLDENRKDGCSRKGVRGLKNVSRACYAIDKESGNEIIGFPSLQAAADFFGTTKNHIHLCIKHKTKTPGKYNGLNIPYIFQYA